MTSLLYHSYRQIAELNRALGSLRRAGFGPLTEPYQAVYKLRGAVMGKLGFRAPKAISLLAKLVGLSPGVIKLWHDAESGWMSEARERPGAPPVYHHVDDDTAIAIIKEELTHEQAAELMRPDEYLGE